MAFMEKHEIRTGHHAEKECRCTSSHQGLSQCKISGETDCVGGNKRTGAGFNDLSEQILQFFNRGKPLVFVLGRNNSDYAVKLLKKRSVQVFDPACLNGICSDVIFPAMASNKILPSEYTSARSSVRLRSMKC